MNLLRVAGLVLALAGCVPAASDRRAGSGSEEISLVCGPEARGQQVAVFPTDGQTRWRIHDTAPGSLAPRAQYVTGFDDRCARRITAALLVFGSPAVHETLRYDPSHAVPYDRTDRAYERIKAQTCGVGPQIRCPAGRLARLERRVTFVTVYPTFGATRGLTELLLDRSGIVASSST